MALVFRAVQIKTTKRSPHAPVRMAEIQTLQHKHVGEDAEPQELPFVDSVAAKCCRRLGRSVVSPKAKPSLAIPSDSDAPSCLPSWLKNLGP